MLQVFMHEVSMLNFSLSHHTHTRIQTHCGFILLYAPIEFILIPIFFSLPTLFPPFLFEYTSTSVVVVV